jgi:hypothetical protein
MALPSIPILAGGGAIITTCVAIVGFVLAVRTGLSAGQLALVVGGAAGVSLGALALSPLARTAVTGLAYAILILFPLYALFWVLHDFVERVVQS